MEARTKLVVRLLPPSLSEEAFKQAIGEWLDSADWFSYWQGKPSARELGHSRAYLNFPNEADGARFRQAFDGHGFLNERGTQHRCSVEYAPHQRVPRPKARRDPKEGTLDRDEDFVAFVARMQEDPQLLPSAEIQLQQREAAAAAATAAAVGDPGAGTVPVTTPLMAYLNQKALKARSGRRAAKVATRVQATTRRSCPAPAAVGHPPASAGGGKGKPGKPERKGRSGKPGTSASGDNGVAFGGPVQKAEHVEAGEGDRHILQQEAVAATAAAAAVKRALAKQPKKQGKGNVAVAAVVGSGSGMPRSLAGSNGTDNAGSTVDGTGTRQPSASRKGGRAGKGKRNLDVHTAAPHADGAAAKPSPKILLRPRAADEVQHSVEAVERPAAVVKPRKPVAVPLPAAAKGPPPGLGQRVPATPPGLGKSPARAGGASGSSQDAKPRHRPPRSQNGRGRGAGAAGAQSLAAPG